METRKHPLSKVVSIDSLNTAEDITAVLKSMANQSQALQLLRFFKTGPGEYGEGDVFIGLKNPQVRLVVKEAWNYTPICEAVKLVQSPWHEVRLCGLLILVEKYLYAMKRKDTMSMSVIFDTYVSLHARVNNWDLVDLSAIKIVGNHEVQNPEIQLMDDWIKPENHTLWQQRIALVSTWMLIRHHRPDACFRRCKQVIDSRHDLLHKAAGWMIRESWKKGFHEDVLDFLEEYVAMMPSIMLSYACEKMAPDQRKYWQKRRKGF